MRRLLARLRSLARSVPGRGVDPTDGPAARRARARLSAAFAVVSVVATGPLPFAGLPGVPADLRALPVLVALLAVAGLCLWRGARLADREFVAVQLVLVGAVTLLLLLAVDRGSARSAELVLVVPLVMAALLAGSRGQTAVVAVVAVAGAGAGSVHRLVHAADAVSQVAAQSIGLLLLAGLLRAMRDASQRSATALRLTEVTDQLTGALNRLGFERSGGALWSQAATGGRRLAVLALSLDHFKTVNDLWGHAGGDDMLARLGAVLRESTRDGDLIVRLGGAEFAVLCPVEAGEGTRVADRVRLDLGRAIAPGTVSIGVVEVSPGPADRPVDELWRHVLVASSCLDRAKRGGRNRVVAQEV